MVAEILGVVKGDPLPIDVPLVAEVYHFMVVPVGPVAVRPTVPVPHRTPPVVEVMLDPKIICTGVEFVDTGPLAQVTLHLYQVGATGTTKRLDEIAPEISV